jgi:non-canonical poly(A) RNA polymerase PAPD5/7
MQRARCCAANAYDAPSAINAIYGRASGSRYIGWHKSTHNNVRSQSRRAPRSYSTSRGHDASVADATTKIDSRARKMAFYEELMGGDSADKHNRKPDHRAEDVVGKSLVHKTNRRPDQRAKDFVGRVVVHKTNKSPNQRVEGQHAAETAKRHIIGGKERPKHPIQEQIVESPWDTHLGAGQPGEIVWKTRMAALSAYIREIRPMLVREMSGEEVEGSKTPRTLNYGGDVILPEDSNVDPPIREPWLQNDQLGRRPRRTAAQLLEKEITAFSRWMSPTQAEQEARELVRSNMRICIKNDPNNEHTSIIPFGSTQTGVAMPYSDIDIGLLNPKDPRDTLETQMLKLKRTLEKGTDYILVVYRPPPNAILTAQHKSTGIDVQIIAKGKPGRQDMVMEKYLKTIPHLHQLYAVVRTAFGIRGFVDPYIGGISAYGTFMMVVAALTRRGTPAHIHESTSAQLLHFLSFWSTFDMQNYGMTLYSSEIGDMKAKPFRKINLDTVSQAERHQNMQAALRRTDWMRAGQYRLGVLRPRQPYLLCLQDPALATNDLGGNCHAIKHMQETIRAMHRDLVRAMAEHDQTRADGAEIRDQPPLLRLLVGRCHETYAERRENIAANAKTNLKRLWDVRNALNKAHFLADRAPRTSFGTKKLKLSSTEKKAEASPGTSS